MDKKNNSRNNNVEETQNNGRLKFIGRNIKEQYQGIGSRARIEERNWSSLGTRWNCLYGRTNIHSKQQKAQGMDFAGES